MTDPSPSIPPRKKLIIPGAPIEEPSEPEVADPEEAVAEEFAEQVEADDPIIEQAYEESAEFVEGVDDLAQANVSEEVEEDDFLMVDGQPVEEQSVETVDQAAAPHEIAPAESKVVRRLLPRGAVHDDTAPVPRRFSSFQTSAVSVGTGQVPLAEPGVYEEAAHQGQVEQAHVAAHHGTSAGAISSVGGVVPVMQSHPTYVQTKSGLPTWIFSLIGFLFGVLTVLILVKLGIMPPALGLTDQKALREAVNDERARIINILEEDGHEGEDWDNFEE